MTRCKGISAVWLGFFDSELECDSYLREDFEADFGFNPDEWCGTTTLGVMKSDIPVSDLLQGFPYKEFFANPAALKARQMGFDRASAAYVVFGAKYDDSMIENPLAQMTFIGNFGR